MTKNRVLLIEDDELDVISVERSLKKLLYEYELLTAYNGLEALEMLKGKQGDTLMNPLPNLILLDLNMPGMNGIEFLKLLRSDADLKNIKVFVMTTSGDENDRVLTGTLGVSGYLIKPLNFTNNSKRKDSLDGFFQFHIGKIFREHAQNSGPF